MLHLDLRLISDLRSQISRQIRSLQGRARSLTFGRSWAIYRQEITDSTQDHPLSVDISAVYWLTLDREFHAGSDSKEGGLFGSSGLLSDKSTSDISHISSWMMSHNVKREWISIDFGEYLSDFEGFKVSIRHPQWKWSCSGSSMGFRCWWWISPWRGRKEIDRRLPKREKRLKGVHSPKPVP